MSSVVIPDLKEKFRVLRTYTSRTRWPALAEAFGASHKTLQYWAQGSAVRAPELLPERALPVLIALVAEMLPPGRSDDEVRRLALGSARQLEEEVRSGSAALLSSIIAKEGRFGTAILNRRSDLSSLIEMEEAPSRDLPRIAAGEPFRIEVPPRRGCAYAAVLQNAQRAWAIIPVAKPTAATPRWLVPGLGSTGSPAFMQERRDLGLHRFVCFQSADPFPVWIDEHRREGTTLDKQGLERLASFYQARSASGRACHVLDLIVEAAAHGRSS